MKEASLVYCLFSIPIHVAKTEVDGRLDDVKNFTNEEATENKWPFREAEMIFYCKNYIPMEKP